MKNKKIFLILFLVLFLFVSIKTETKAFQPLDEIHLYETTINPRKDGTFDVTVKITWEVLDSTTEGPLEWIKVGVPNKYVDEIKAISSNIVDIKYKPILFEGSFIAIYLDKPYYAGEIINIEYSYHQSRMYILRGQYCDYNFSIGYFNEIKVDKAIVKFNKENVFNANTMDQDEKYFIWEDELNFGETIKIQIRFKESNFIGLNTASQFNNQTYGVGPILLIVCFPVAFFFICMFIVNLIQKFLDPYGSDRGFVAAPEYHPLSLSFRRKRVIFRDRYYGGIRRPKSTINSPTMNSHIRRGTSSHPVGRGFSCACACACAGGGRAGCSTKDFYKTNLQINKFKI